MRVAILEASHWHVPLYLDALAEADGVEVVAISDAENGRGAEVAERFSAKLYERYDNLLDREKPDFVFAFGRHCELSRIARALLDMDIAFAIEKPCGMNATEVGELRQIAAERSAFAAVPLIFGFSELAGELEKLRTLTGADWQHMSFRFIAGPVQRYLDNFSPWMLESRFAGGGCMINLAVHFVDLVLRLTGDSIGSVSARTLRDPAVADVEIFSAMSLRTETGKIGLIETGYTYPGGTAELRDFSFTLASNRFHVSSGRDSMRYVPRDGATARQVAVALNTDLYYSTFVRDTIRRFREGVGPASGLADMQRIMKVIDSAYESDRRDGAAIVP